ncbi:MAG: zinc ribbon domain-containing protein, partial [Candidatus Lutacidiplasmatales archaeon]
MTPKRTGTSWTSRFPMKRIRSLGLRPISGPRRGPVGGSRLPGPHLPCNRTPLLESSEIRGRPTGLWRAAAPLAPSKAITTTPRLEGPTVYCNRCGTLVPDDAAFCQRCGAAMGRSGTGAAATPLP